MKGLRPALLLCWSVVLAAGARAGNAAPPNLPAAASDYVVRQWTVEDGLPHDDVFQLLQDRRGYLWVAARSGLARFDGTTFVPYTAPEIHDIIFGLAEEPDGALLLTLRSGDPVRFRNGVAAKDPLPAPYTGRPVLYALVAPDGARWFSLRGAVLRLAGGKVQAFTTGDGISAQGATRLAVDGRQRIWVASDLLLARHENGRLVAVPLPGPASELRIISSRRGGPWVLTDTQVFKLDEADHFAAVAEVPTLLGAHYVGTGFEDRNGQLWLGTRSHGLHLIRGGRPVPVPASGDAIMALTEDREGTVWVGTAVGGLDAIAPRVCTLFDKAAGLPTAAVSAVCADASGDVWAANGDGGVVRIRAARVERRELRRDARVLGAVSVAPHPDGGVWATARSALFHVTADLDVVPVEIPDVGLQPTSLAARNGDLWLAVGDRRAARLRGGELQTFGPEEGVGPSGVRSFAETPRGEILAGTNDGALLRFDGRRFGPVQPEVRAGSAINSIVEMSDGYWLATAANGLLVVSTGRVVRLGAAQGLPDDTLTQLMPDGQGGVWCGSGRGVFRLRLADVAGFVRGESRSVPALRLGADEGLGTITCQGIYGPGSARTADGRIWFATRQGVLAVNPSAEALTPAAPVVAIEGVRADDVPQRLDRPLTVRPAGRKLELRFSVLCLAAPSRVRARYRLDGFDTDWVAAGAGRTAVYPRLAPGRYRFEVAAGFGDPATEHRDALEIVVPVPWWQAWWLRLAVLAALGAAVAWAVRSWVHRRLRRRIEKLERETAVARERARIAQNIHDDVGASLTRISLLTQASSPSSPEAENLNRIYETAREITRSLDEIVWAVNPRYDTLESFVRYLTDSASKFLGVAGVRCRLAIPATLAAVPLSSELRHDLFLCCREALNNVVKHARASEVLIRLTCLETRLTVVITDNGRGPHAPAEAPSERVSAGHGIRNMQERMQRHGGSCAVEPGAGGGTTVTLLVALGATPKTTL